MFLGFSGHQEYIGERAASEGTRGGHARAGRGPTPCRAQGWRGCLVAPLCRGGVTADAIGMAKMGRMVVGGIRGGFMHSRSTQARTRKKPQEHELETKKPRTQSTPRCTLLRGPLVEVTPLLQHYPTQCIAQRGRSS